jgi:GNAT superfamily N-acetyltransferase
MIKIYKEDKEKVDFCKVAIKQHLFSCHHWSLKWMYKNVVDGAKMGDVYYVYYLNDIPVGVLRWHGTHTWIFVKHAYRRKGIGTELIRYIEKEGKKFHPDRGTNVSHKFFKKLGYKK